MSALSDRDTNVQPTSSPIAAEKQTAEGAENMAHDASNTKQSAEQKFSLNNDKQSATYISPSDSILSPASQKLSNFKQKQITKQTGGKTPAARTLFARTASSCSNGGFEDFKDGEEKA
ncbi:uncharacterized protein LTR77_008561 [Saxophila tyrrhenica]|uniref:Uncharacterized protein n=1 Tax=Saxophila tyrrhenica TaxID=1690608 RepID=A0AAV9P503_9PEZI|nr:hypothetical protein LTR77_008561 [Saxophila tyrrhenica]